MAVTTRPVRSDPVLALAPESEIAVDTISDADAITREIGRQQRDVMDRWT